MLILGFSLNFLTSTNHAPPAKANNDPHGSARTSGRLRRRSVFNSFRDVKDQSPSSGIGFEKSRRAEDVNPRILRLSTLYLNLSAFQPLRLRLRKQWRHKITLYGIGSQSKNRNTFLTFGTYSWNWFFSHNKGHDHRATEAAASETAASKVLHFFCLPTSRSAGGSAFKCLLEKPKSSFVWMASVVRSRFRFFALALTRCFVARAEAHATGFRAQFSKENLEAIVGAWKQPGSSANSLAV